jgi:hypothetical protein
MRLEIEQRDAWALDEWRQSLGDRFRLARYLALKDRTKV